MTVSPELMHAILSIDSYNRGYDSGVVVDGDAIGTATVTARDTYVDDTEYAAWQAAGFYAVAYQWNGETVISYRGTDVLWHELPFVDLPIWSGDYDEPQLELVL